MTKKARGVILTILVFFASFFIMARFDLFNPYNEWRAKFQIWTGRIYYPQCEFEGTELERANRISKNFGFKVILVDCDAFYTNGMDKYERLMIKELNNRNGADWHEQFTDSLLHSH